MKLITRNTDYAMRALILMAKRKNKVVSVRELVKELKIPRPFLRKILQTLNKKNILKSFKGKNGGFLLLESPNNIFLGNLINIFQGPFKLNECIFKKRICPDSNVCILKQKIDSMERYIIDELRAITIESLL